LIYSKSVFIFLLETPQKQNGEQNGNSDKKKKEKKEKRKSLPDPEDEDQMEEEATTPQKSTNGTSQENGDDEGSAKVYTVTEIGLKIQLYL
jgi:hypothetical protein